jgi:hypothetical protein
MTDNPRNGVQENEVIQNSMNAMREHARGMKDILVVASPLNKVWPIFPNSAPPFQHSTF